MFEMRFCAAKNAVGHFEPNECKISLLTFSCCRKKKDFVKIFLDKDYKC